MTHRTNPELDSFETALLAELKTAVGQTASAAQGRPELFSQPHGPRPRRRYVLVAVAAAAALAIAVLVPGLGPRPAYAVTGRNNGEVIVHVTRLDGADGLEQPCSSTASEQTSTIYRRARSVRPADTPLSARQA